MENRLVWRSFAVFGTVININTLRCPQKLQSYSEKDFVHIFYAGPKGPHFYALLGSGAPEGALGMQQSCTLGGLDEGLGPVKTLDASIKYRCCKYL